MFLLHTFYRYVYLGTTVECVFLSDTSIGQKQASKAAPGDRFQTSLGLQEEWTTLLNLKRRHVASKNLTWNSVKKIHRELSPDLRSEEHSSIFQLLFWCLLQASLSFFSSTLFSDTASSCFLEWMEKTTTTKRLTVTSWWTKRNI